MFRMALAKDGCTDNGALRVEGHIRGIPYIE